MKFTIAGLVVAGFVLFWLWPVEPTPDYREQQKRYESNARSCLDEKTWAVVKPDALDKLDRFRFCAQLWPGAFTTGEELPILVDAIHEAAEKTR